MAYKVVGFIGGHLKVDDGEEFGLLFEGTEIRHNNTPVNLDWQSQIEIERKDVGDEYFAEVLRKKGTQLNLSFKCSVNIEQVTERMVKVAIDGKPAFALGIKVRKVICGEQRVNFAETGTFSFVRTSGEDPTVATLKTRNKKLRFWFARKLQFRFLPIEHNPEIAAFLRRATPMGVTAQNRIDAYNYQRFGLRALLPKEMQIDGNQEWEQIVLTPEERQQIDEENSQKRQQEFEENCGCN